MTKGRRADGLPWTLDHPFYPESVKRAWSYAFFYRMLLRCEERLDATTDTPLRSQ